MAFPVAVKMIFALLRKEFNGALKALAPLYGAVEPRIGHGNVKQAGLPAQLGGRVGVRVGDKLKGVKGRQPPVHGRIRGQSCLQGMNLGSQLLIAFFNGIKTGKCPEQRKMRGPDVGRNIDGIRACLQCYGQKIVTVQSQDGASVRMYVADGFQPPGKHFGCFQAGQEDKAVYLAHTAVFLVNGADFPADNKTGAALAQYGRAL